MTPAPFYAEVANGPKGGAAHWLTTSDGLRIRAGHWTGGTKGTILLFPGRTEYVEKYGRAATEFLTRGYSVLAVDWRGQGIADRMLNDRAAGHVHHFPDYQKDVSAVLAHARALGLPEPYHLIGHSMGGCIGLRALYEGLPVKSAMFSAPMWGIIIAPALRPFAWMSSWTARRVGQGHRLAPGTEPVTYVMSTPFDDNTLTTDRAMFDYMKAQLSAHPELALGGPSLHWLNEALMEMRRLAARPSPATPAITFLGSNERIVEPSRIHDRMADYPNGKLVMLDGAEHEVMMETPVIRTRVFNETTAWFDAHS